MGLGELRAVRSGKPGFSNRSTCDARASARPDSGASGPGHAGGDT